MSYDKFQFLRDAALDEAKIEKDLVLKDVATAHSQPVQDDKGQLRLELADSQVLEGARMWWYTVLATNVSAIAAPIVRAWPEVVPNVLLVSATRTAAKAVMHMPGARVNGGRANKS